MSPDDSSLGAGSAENWPDFGVGQTFMISWEE
jgi:hypothetical protein